MYRPKHLTILNMSLYIRLLGKHLKNKHNISVLVYLFIIKYLRPIPTY